MAGNELSINALSYIGEYNGYPAYSVSWYDNRIDGDIPDYPSINDMLNTEYGFRMPFGGMMGNKYELTVAVQPAPADFEQIIAPDNPMFAHGYDSLTLCDCFITKRNEFCAELVLLTGITFNRDVPRNVYDDACQAAINAMCDLVG